MKKVIALMTDFGLRDAFVASMKGVILSICPDANIVDLSHEVDSFDVLHGALLLSSSAKFFPDGTIFVGVVDPGVGTERRGIVVETKRHVAVGPDNGLFSLLMEKEGVVGVYEIRNKSLLLDLPFETFHGLTVFSPVAAHIANGLPPSSAGPKISDYVKMPLPRVQVRGSKIVAEALHVDRFGNIITNVSTEDIHSLGLKRGTLLRAETEGGTVEAPLEKSYGYVPTGSFVFVLDSYGFLELAVNQGNAAKLLGLKRGSPIEITVLK
ncbi:MAG: SAM-dependent chlorinase/fluorinase [Candidatus Freyarchaeota archaeon]|nr:SAM-dependent chlorinase/fluorinase [Candidatus Jordarchaeia archaeon]